MPEVGRLHSPPLSNTNRVRNDRLADSILLGLELCEPFTPVELMDMAPAEDFDIDDANAE